MNVPRPIIQSNTTTTTTNNNTSSSAATFKITQVGPVIGSNVIVSRMDGSNAIRPTSASPIPISGPLANLNNTNNNNYYFNSGNTNIPTNPIAKAQINPRPQQNNISSNNNFYHSTANNVTKFTNMTVANAGAKNPLKPTHYTVPTHSSNPAANSNIVNSNNSRDSIVNLATHPNANLTAPNTSGIAPKTTLKASDLIHILPNLFNTLKRRNSNSGASGNTSNATAATGKGFNGTGNSSGYFNGSNSNTLAAAVVAAASNSGKQLTTSSAAVLVAEQLLNAAASGPFSDDSSSSPPPHHQQSLSKRIKTHDSSALQCEVCGKTYKHRNCLSKHMWEHHESWEHTKKVCQTKHQQVQLLEAAQVLTEIVTGIRSSTNSSRNSSSDAEEEGDVDSDDQENYIEDGLREMKIVPSTTASASTSSTTIADEDENISIGGEDTTITTI